mmetsp:Transcript_17970/g.35140  ORF Transcript_17970/g.35140 Transcript_17970/m.35140 type:complete len:80 (+) Transcript_17970:571-810(+)
MAGVREVVFAEHLPTSIARKGQEIQLSATWGVAMRSALNLHFHAAQFKWCNGQTLQGKPSELQVRRQLGHKTLFGRCLG